jgi:hypothetical protein
MPFKYLILSIHLVLFKFYLFNFNNLELFIFLLILVIINFQGLNHSVISHHKAITFNFKVIPKNIRFFYCNHFILLNF